MPRPPFVPYRPKLKRYAQSLRRDPTPAERKLWYEFLRDLPEKFTRQKPLGSAIADFYCARLLLVVEVDGDSHYTGPGASSDEHRTAMLKERQIRVLRFTNREVMEEFEGVCGRIRAALDESPASLGGRISL